MTIQIKKISDSANDRTGTPESSSSVDDASGKSRAFITEASAMNQALGLKVNELIDEVYKLDSKVDKQEDELKNQSARNIEIIGVFSAILALIIIDVSIIKSVSNFLTAILLIVALTCSLSIFALLIHSFFGSRKTRGVGPYFWIPTSILILLVLIGLLSYGWENRFNITISSDQKQIQTQTSTIDTLAPTNP